MRDDDGDDDYDGGARSVPAYWTLLRTKDGRVLGVEADPPYTQGSWRTASWVKGNHDVDIDVVMIARNVVNAPPAPPPGLGLVERALHWAMPPKMHKRVIAETIADFKQEYAEARAAGQTGRARWFVVLGYLAIVRALVAQVLPIIELIRKLGG